MCTLKQLKMMMPAGQEIMMMKKKTTENGGWGLFVKNCFELLLLCFVLFDNNKEKHKNSLCEQACGKRKGMGSKIGASWERVVARDNVKWSGPSVNNNKSFSARSFKKKKWHTTPRSRDAKCSLYSRINCGHAIGQKLIFFKSLNVIKRAMFRQIQFFPERPRAKKSFKVENWVAPGNSWPVHKAVYANRVCFWHRWPLVHLIESTICNQ